MPVAMTEEERLRVAGESLSHFKAMDEQFPSVDDKFSLVPGWAIKGSGGGESDYPDLRPRGLNLQFFATKKKISVPSPILEAQNRGSSIAMCGVFPEIHRAWATVDSDIYLWRYQDGRDVAAYNALTEIVVALGIVVPPSQPGVNPSPTNSMLVAVTATKIHLLTISFNPSVEGGSTDRFGLINIGEDSVLTLATDGVVYDVVHGMGNGRLFLGGRDGHLYEVIYTKKHRWGSSMAKINHSSSTLSYLVPGFLAPTLLSRPDPITRIVSDCTKNTLFTLSSRGGVTAYYLGPGGDCLTRIGSLSEDQVTRSVLEASCYGAIEKQCIGMLVDITAIPAFESRYMHMVGMTDAGIRVYFTCTPDMNPMNVTPYDLKPVHVRLPPGFAANAGPHRPRQVRQGYCCRGITLMSAGNPLQWPDQYQLSTSDNTDALWAISSDLYAGSPLISESYELLRFDGIIKTVVEIQDPKVKLLAWDNRPLPPANVLLQFIRPRIFIVMTASEMITVEALRPLDQLELLLTNHTTNVENSTILRSFFDLLRVDQACVLALSLACGVKQGKGGLVVEKAARALLAFGCNSAVTYRSHQMTMAGQTLPHAQVHQMQQQTRFSLGSPLHASSFGSPGPHQQSMVTPVKRLAPFTSTPYPGSLPQQTPGFPYPMSQSPTLVHGGMVAELRPYFSSLHNALYLYFWRLCRPIVIAKVVKEKLLPDGRTYYESNIAERDASYAIAELSSLLKFLRTKCDLLKANIPANPGGSMMAGRPISEEQRYSSGMPFSPMGGSNARMQFGSPYPTGYQQGVGMSMQQYDVSETDVRRAERASIQNLDIFVDRMVQVLEVWKILSTHPFHLVVADAGETTKAFLRNAQVIDLLLEGQPALTDVINALMQRYLKENISIEGLCNSLRNVCPKVYRDEEAKCAKASELIRAASATENLYERMKLAEEALNVSKTVALKVNIIETCGEFASVQAFRHIVDMCTTAGRMADPENRAIRYYHATTDNEYADPDCREAYYRRVELYKPVVGVLYDLLVQGKSIEPRSGAFSLLVARNTAIPTDMRQKWVDSENEASQSAGDIIRTVTRERDELLHVELFKFLIEEGLSGLVLDLKSEYLVDFLKRMSKSSGASHLILENLWRLHEREGAYQEAASVLIRLAEKKSHEIPLCARIVYLGKALSCLRGRRPGPGTACASFLGEVHDKLEVARVQSRVLSAIEEKLDIPPATKARLIAELNHELYPVIDLYQQYALPLELYDCQLAVIYSAEHLDTDSLVNAWTSLINHELKTSEYLSPAERVTRLRSRVEDLAREFNDRPGFIPYGLLVKFLEQRSAEEGFDDDDDVLRGWVWKMMKNCGASETHLLDTYESMRRQKDRMHRVGRPLQVEKSMSGLLLTTARDCTLNPHAYTRSLRERVMDLATQLYVDLQVMGAGNRELNSILNTLRNVQDLLEGHRVS